MLVKGRMHQVGKGAHVIWKGTRRQTFSSSAAVEDVAGDA